MLHLCMQSYVMQLSPQRKLEVRDAADKLLLDAGITNELPIHTEKVASHLGYRVQAFIPSKVTEGISGAVDYNDKIIFINADEVPVRQHFTLAHEIGHIQLHNGETIVDFREALFSPTSEKEHEANEFAGVLLMPSESFYLRWIETGGELADMRKIFGVSEQAIKMRAGALGLL